MNKQVPALRRGLMAACALSTLAIAAAVAPSVAAAQDADAAQAEEGEAVQGGDIVVTARRREESLQETPIAISAFSAEALEARQITSSQDLEKITPSLQFKPAGQLVGQQLRLGRVHPRHRPARSDRGSRSWRRHLHRRGLCRPFGRRDHRVRRHRQRRSSARPARHAVRTQHHRRRDPGPHARSREFDDLSATGRIRFGDFRPVRGLRRGSTCRCRRTLAARVSGGHRKRDGYVTRAYDGLDLGNENVSTANARPALGADGDLRAFAARRLYQAQGARRAVRLRRDQRECAGARPLSAWQPAARAQRCRSPGHAESALRPPYVPMIDDPRCANDFHDMGRFRQRRHGRRHSAPRKSGACRARRASI